MAVYLLHYDIPLRRGNGVLVRHYTGWCLDKNLARRVDQHTRGRGHSAFTEAMARIGSTPTVALVIWDGDKYVERTLKSHGHLKHRCPICRPALVGTALPDEYLAEALYAKTPSAPSKRRRNGTAGSTSATSPTPASSTSRVGRPRIVGTALWRSQKRLSASGTTDSPVTVQQAREDT
jgi:hypothetical protein